MKFTVSKAALLQGLQVVQNVVSVRSTLPILSNVLVKAETDKLVLTTTDLDLSVSCTVEASITKAGVTTLPVRRLSSIARELPDSNIEFDVDDKDHAQLECNASFFKIIGMSQEEFPPVTTPSGEYAYHLDQGVFREMLKKCSYAASTDETRYVLNGVYLNFNGGKLTMVATDGRRLALVESEVEVPPDAEADLILPSKTVVELEHTLAEEGDLKIHAKENQILFEYGNVVVSSKLIDGTYPNYRQVIPTQCEQRIAVERESLLTALKRVSLVTTDKSNAAKLTFHNNQLIVSGNSPEIGEARETLPVKYTGKELNVAFNPEYMMDPLKNLDNDEIYAEFTDELSPGVIKCDIPFLYVLMPMRVS